MNKYPYARTYLRTLVTLAVLVVLAGLAFVCLQIVGITSDVSGYQAAKNAPLTINTKDLVSELKYASVVVGSFALQHRDTPAPPDVSGDDFLAELKKGNIGVGEVAQLRGQQIAGFEFCLQVARNDSKACKAELLKEFLATLEDIATPVKSILKNAESEAEEVSKSGTAGSSEDPAQAGEPRQQLFGSDSLAEMQFDDLNAAISFLRKGPQSDIVTYISPQAGMRTAADELQALLQLIQVDLQRLQGERQVHITDEEQSAPTAANTSTKVAVLRRFLDQLSLCEQLAKVNISRGWVVDAQIEKAGNMAASFRAQQGERLVYLRSDMAHSAMLAGIAVLLTAIVALMLLMIRDFLSALIDTAVNTGTTANTLDRIRQGDTTGSGE